jgi:hypothetical protein
MTIIIFFKCSYPFLYDSLIKIVNSKKVKKKSVNTIKELQKNNIRSSQKKFNTKKRKMTQKNENLKIKRLKSIANPIKNNRKKNSKMEDNSIPSNTKTISVLSVKDNNKLLNFDKARKKKKNFQKM